MTVTFDIKFEGLEEVIQKIDSCWEGGAEGKKMLEEATRNVALKADRMIKEATPKGKYGYYNKDGEFMLRRKGIKQGGTARKAWQFWRVADGYNLGNTISYVKYIRYAWKRASDVVDETFTAPKRLLTDAIKKMEETLNDYYQQQIIERFGKIWG